MFVAHKLKKDVQLCTQMDYEKARDDICVKSIKIAINSQNAFCSNGSDMTSIHEAIQKNNPSQNGFNGMNRAVERIWLDYLFKYQVIDLEFRITRFSEMMVINYPLRYLTILMPLFIIGMIVYFFGYHFYIVILPLVGLIFDILLVRIIGNETLTMKH